MKSLIKIGVFLLGPVFLMLLSGNAMGQKGMIRIGKMRVIPNLSIKTIYDDNIYLGNGTNNSTELKENDWIIHISPSIRITQSLTGRGNIRLGYRGNITNYNENDNNDWDTHSGLLNLDYKAPGGIFLGLDMVFTYTEDPFSSINQFKLGVPQTERWSNNLHTRMGYDFGNRLRLLGYFNYYKQDYEQTEDFSQDYYHNEFGTGLQFRLLPKTWGFFRYHFGERDYNTHPAGTGVTETNDSDFDWQRINMGLAWEATARLTGELNLGYQWENYDNLTDVNGNRYQDRNTLIAATSLSLKASPTTRLALSLTRALRESASDTNEFFYDTGFGLNLQRTIIPKFFLTVGGIYILNEYNLPVNEPREDDNYRANIGLEYKIRDWLKAGAGYHYKQKESNNLDFEYRDNQFMIFITAGPY